MDNAQVAAVFDEIADILELKGGEDFRVRSYRNAARTVRDLPESIEEVARDKRKLLDLPGIGESIADKIVEILKTGTARRLEELRTQVPPGLGELLRVPGLGPKRARQLYEELGVKSLEELKAAAEAHRICGLEHLGEKTEEKIRRGIATVESAGSRVKLKEADDRMRSLGEELDRLASVRRWTPAGSWRRRRETVGDLDVLVDAPDRDAAAGELVALAGVEGLVERGPEKVTVRLAGGLAVNFRFHKGDAHGAALLYFTGSKEHNIRLRRAAQERGWKLNEYGIFDGQRRLAGRTEEEMYEKLALAFVPPELREDRGEIEAAAAGELPRLVESGDIRGDLHVHTRETDGHNTIAEMAAAARDRGYEYLAITDHSKAVTVARGMDETRCRRHVEAIRSAAADLEDLWLMAGIEVDILKTGRLDMPEKLLAELDWVTASVHSHFTLDEKAMTARMLEAIRSGMIHAISHPFGRQIGARDPIRFDADAVFGECAERGVALEINSYPDRMDLPDTYCKWARELGARMVVTTDAHDVAGLGFLEYGVANARRGWLEKKDVLNALPAAGLRKRLKRPKK